MLKIIKLFVKVFILILILLPGPALAGESKVYVSPNGEHKAYIKTTINNDIGARESGIVIMNKKDRTLLSKSYRFPFSSRYGFFVARAAWTADSKFFVYSMSSDLKGHGYRHHPTFFISIDKYRVVSLDDIYGPIVYPDFKLFPPDTIHAVFLSGTIMDEVYFEEPLSELFNRR